MSPKNVPNGNKYAQIAANWGVEANDVAIYLLKAFDERFEALSHESAELRGEVKQWREITTQLLTIIRDQNSELKILSSNTSVLSESLNKLGQGLAAFESQIETQQTTLQPLITEFEATKALMDGVLITLQPLSTNINSMGTTLTKINTSTINLAQNLPLSEERLGKKIAASRGNGGDFVPFKAIGLGIGVAALIMLLVVGQQLGLINRNLNSVLIRQERLERR